MTKPVSRRLAPSSGGLAEQALRAVVSGDRRQLAPAEGVGDRRQLAPAEGVSGRPSSPRWDGAAPERGEKAPSGWAENGWERDGWEKEGWGDEDPPPLSEDEEASEPFSEPASEEWVDEEEPPRPYPMTRSEASSIENVHQCPGLAAALMAHLHLFQEGWEPYDLQWGGSGGRAVEVPSDGWAYTQIPTNNQWNDLFLLRRSC